MAFYPVKIPWATKPPMGTPIDWSNPLTRGLIAAWAINEGAGRIFTGVGGKLTATAGVNTPDGYQTDGVTVGGGLQLTNALGASAFNFEGDFTVFVDIVHNETSGANKVIVGKGLATTPYPFAVNFDYTNNRWTYARYGTTGTQVLQLFQHGTVANITKFAIGKSGGNLFCSTRNNNAQLYQTCADTTSGTHANTAPFTLGMRDNGYFQCKATYRSVVVYNRALSPDELESLSENPWQIYQPRTVWIPVAASGGGTSYTETLTALAENYAAVTDIAIYIDAAEAIITAGATADATVQMLEGVLSTAEAALTVDDRVTAADTVTADVAADATVQDVGTMQDSVYTEASVEASVIDSIVSGIAENLLASATAITSATDVQLMVDNLTIMAVSGASIGEIYTYLEQLTAIATSGASVTDILVTQFVGRYLFVNTVPPRVFTATVSPRSYIATVGPR